MNLLIHIGHGKTGSSYLQSWLTCNSFLLQNKLQLLYPLKDINGRNSNSSASFGNFSMGNGFILEEALEQWKKNSSDKIFEELFVQNAYVSRETPLGLIFSSETFLPKIPEMLPLLISCSQQLNISAVKILLYVRDPLPHACSVYSQMVKRHGYYKTLDEWVDTFNFPKRLLKSVQVLSSYSDLISLDVFHYDRQRDSIIDGLLQFIGADKSIEWKLPPKKTVNRSLTSNELNLMCLLNKKLGDKTACLGEHFVNNQPNLSPAKLVPSIKSQDGFIEKWQSTIDMINTCLPSGSALRLQNFPQVSESRAKCISDDITLNPQQFEELYRFLVNKR